MTDNADAGQTVRLPELTFYFELTSMRSISATYASDEGFSRSFMAIGTTARNTGGLYRDKPVRVIVAAPASERLASFATEHGVERPCGSILVRRGVEPRHHDEGPPDPAIQVAIAVDHDTLDRLYETVRGSIEGRKILGLNLMAASTAFEGLRHGWPRPEDLDVSEDRAFPVVAFSLTPFIIDLSDPHDVRPRRPDYDRRERTPLTIRMADVRVDLESSSLKPFKIMIGGEIVGHRHFKSMSADIDVVEFERDVKTDHYPEVAYPGEFSFYPKDRGSPPYFKLVLNFTLRDFERMTPLLLAARGSIIETSLNVTCQEIETAREPLYGNIQYVSFSLRAGPAR